MSSQKGTISHNNSYEFVHKIKSIAFKIYAMQDYKLDYIVRKTAHVSEYTVLAFIVSMGAVFVFHKSLNKTFLISTSLCFLYASTDEIHQRFVAGREGCFKDVLIDTFGAIIGFIY
jgi:VanZ family protein